MERIYEVDGVLNRDFRGQITYGSCLNRPYRKLAIVFSFDKRQPEHITDELLEDFLARYALGEDLPPLEDAAVPGLTMGQKTEIHLSATLNGAFIGGMHKQLKTRCLFFAHDWASSGCIPQPVIDGMLNITVIAFRVLLDGTPYRLTVWGE